MAVLALNTFQAGITQLLHENLEDTACKAAEASIRERLSELISRLKDLSNYAGQASRNLYEDVTSCTIATSRQTPNGLLATNCFWLVT